MSLLSTVVFDLDGVLVESEPLWRLAFSEVLSRHLDLPVSVAEMVDFEGGRVNDTISAVLVARRGSADPKEVALLTEQVIDHACEAFVEEGTVIESSVRAVRRIWAEGIVTALASNSGGRFIRVILRELGLDAPPGQGFRAVESALDVEHAKPAPDIYVGVARLLGVPAVDCVAVEDSWRGVRAAVDAGMTCVGLWRKEGEPPADFADCVYVDRGDLDEDRLVDLVRQPQPTAI